jgi:hypothetical protein
MTATPDDPADDDPTVHLDIAYPAGLETADLSTALRRTGAPALQPHGLVAQIERRAHRAT